MQETSPTSIQSHMDSIHSPHSTRNTIMNECIKSVKFQRGMSPSGNRSVLSERVCSGISKGPDHSNLLLFKSLKLTNYASG